MSASLAAMPGRAASLARALAEMDPADAAIGETPKDEVWRSRKRRLFRYRPEREPAAHPTPLLIVHGLVGRHTVADLEPRCSLVRALVSAGIDVYALDWGNASRADRFRDIADFAVHGLGDAVAEVARISGTGRVALLGICQGGVFSLCHAALEPKCVAGVATAIAPVDFHADARGPHAEQGLLNVWLRGLPRELIVDLIAEHGNLPGRLTGAVFQSMTPARTLSKYTTGLLEMAEDRDRLTTFLRMERWLDDRPDHPGAAALDWLIGLYQENRLAEGRFDLDGRTVCLDAIRCPVLNIYGTEDHIVPPPCSIALGSLLAPGHDYQEVAVPSGHVGVFVSRRARGIVAPALMGWLARIR